MIEPQVGYWWTECCMLDLNQITSEQELSEVRTRIAEGLEDGDSIEVFATREDAAKVLAHDGMMP